MPLIDIKSFVQMKYLLFGLSNIYHGLDICYLNLSFIFTRNCY